MRSLYSTELSFVSGGLSPTPQNPTKEIVIHHPNLWLIFLHEVAFLTLELSFEMLLDSYKEPSTIIYQEYQYSDYY